MVYRRGIKNDSSGSSTHCTVEEDFIFSWSWQIRLMSSRVETYLTERKSAGGPLANVWLELESLYQSRLWHELTLRVTSLVHEEELQQGEQLIRFYENFLSDFEHRINQLALVEIIIPITRTFKQVDQAIQFVQQIREKVKSNALAVLLCDITIGKAYLLTKNLTETKKIIEDLAPQFDELDHLTTVHSRYLRSRLELLPCDGQS